jgi:hypothetical protein
MGNFSVGVRVGDLDGAAQDDQRKAEQAEEKPPRRTLPERFGDFANHAITHYRRKHQDSGLAHSAESANFA